MAFSHASNPQEDEIFLLETTKYIFNHVIRNDKKLHEKLCQVNEITECVLKNNLKINLDIPYADRWDRTGRKSELTILMALASIKEYQVEPALILECMQNLIKAGASLKIKNGNDQNPLEYVLYTYKKNLFFENVNLFTEPGTDDYLKILKRIQEEGVKLGKEKHLLSIVMLLLNAGATFDPKVFSYNMFERFEDKAFDLFTNSKISQLNILFLFLKEMHEFILDKQATADLAYVALYWHWHDLVGKLSDTLSTPEEKTDGIGSKSFTVLHQEAKKICKTLPKPKILINIKNMIEDHLISVLGDIVIDYYFDESTALTLHQRDKSNRQNHYPSFFRSMRDAVSSRLEWIADVSRGSFF